MEINNKELFETLTRGRNSAQKLQNLLRRKVNDDGSVSVDDLVTEISQSFYGGLLVLNSSNSGEHSRVPVSARLSSACSGEHSRVPVSAHLSSACSGEHSRVPVSADHLSSACSGDQIQDVHTGDTTKTPAPAVKGRRGCYKRRKTMDSRMEVSDTIEDGYAWRKYGQKEILNSNYPRCYYRCTNKQVHGCKALKQVQQIDESNMFQIMYFGQHTCPPPHTSSSHGGHEIDCENLEKHQNLPNSPLSITNNDIAPSMKQEELSNKVSLASGAQSPPDLVWEEILLDEFECFKNDGSLSDIFIS